MSATSNHLRDQALAVRIEDEADRRGIRLEQRSRYELVGPCPVCGGNDRFAINTKKQKFNCRKCEVGGNVITFVRHLDDVGDREAVAMLTQDDRPRSSPAQGPAPAEPEFDAEYSKYALGFWHSAHSATGTLVEVYLRSRCITIPAPPCLRHAPRLWHKESGDAWPGMVALVTRGSDGAPIAVHRTYIGRDGGGKAPIAPDKKTLGPISGGVIRLAAPVDGHVMIGEGIETCLAAMQLAAAQGDAWPAWSALSAGGMRSLDLPDYVQRITVLADRDADGKGEAAAVAAARRWRREGRVVKIARPPAGVKDFAVLLEAVQKEVVS